MTTELWIVVCALCFIIGACWGFWVGVKSIAELHKRAREEDY